jgi:hypothetical protein
MLTNRLLRRNGARVSAGGAKLLRQGAARRARSKRTSSLGAEGVRYHTASAVSVQSKRLVSSMGNGSGSHFSVAHSHNVRPGSCGWVNAMRPPATASSPTTGKASRRGCVPSGAVRSSRVALPAVSPTTSSRPSSTSRTSTTSLPSAASTSARPSATLMRTPCCTREPSSRRLARTA